MKAYQLLARLEHTTLIAEDGVMEFWGNEKQWRKVRLDERAHRLVREFWDIWA